MPKVSVNILTKNRAELLREALMSVKSQFFKDIEVIVISDGSTDNTAEVEREFIEIGLPVRFIFHNQSLGITQSRQDALNQSKGEYIAVLDDDDQWLDKDKLTKQVKFLDDHPELVLCGGGITINSKFQIPNSKFRPQTDSQIRKTMLLRNNFFTSTVMFRRETAIKAGGFISDGVDVAEDYDLWLRMGQFGRFYNFPEVFTLYRQPAYNKERFKQFLVKQLKLIGRHKSDYPYYYPAAVILYLRLKYLIS